MTRIRELAAATPAWRDRYVDLLRALAITAVVLGHWLIMTVGYDQQGGITGTSALAELTWVHPVSWLFQVMPVFFMVGGYANAISLGRHRQRGGRDSGWLLGRSARLIRPTTMLLLVLAAGAVVVGLLWQAVAGSGHHGPFGFPTGALLLYLAGAAILRAGTAARLGRRPDPPSRTGRAPAPPARA